MIRKSLISWLVRNEELEVINYIFQKFLISLWLLFDKNNFIKLDNGNAVWEEIADMFFLFMLLLFTTQWTIRNQNLSVSDMLYHGFPTWWISRMKGTEWITIFVCNICGKLKTINMQAHCLKFKGQFMHTFFRSNVFIPNQHVEHFSEKNIWKISRRDYPQTFF